MRTLCRALWVTLMAASSAWAVPQVVRIDGSVFDSSGVPVTGNRDIQIKAYDAATAGSLLWTSSVYNTSVAAGKFTIHLDGSVGSPSLAESLSARTSGQGIYFQIEVDSGAADGAMDTATVVLPRIRAKGTTFALAAVRADTLTGVSVTAGEINYLGGATNSVQTQLNAKLALAGGTMAGTLALAGAPTNNLDAATKSYVDAASGGANDFENVKSYVTGVTTTWTAPAGVTRIKVEVCGGGGSGGGSPSSCSFGGGGGGSGAMAWGYYTVTPGNSYNVIVGAGGAAPSAIAAGTVGGTGGSSSFDGAIIAGGGLGGAKELVGGNGGAPSGSANFYGQPGNPGVTVAYSPGSYFGFHGGSSPCGGVGGSPGVMYPVNINGAVGGSPGGGGGGSGCYGAGAPGAGGAGRVTIWY